MASKKLRRTPPKGNDALSDTDRPRLGRSGKSFVVTLEHGSFSTDHRGRTPWDALQAARAAHPDSFVGWCTVCGGTRWEPSWDGKGEHPPPCTRCAGTGSTADDRAR